MAIARRKFDCLVIGAGGGGLRAALQLAEGEAHVAVVSKVFPTRSHTVAAQGGMNAALGNVSPDDWHWHMYDTIKGGDYLADQDAVEYMCRAAPRLVIELEHYGVPFTRLDNGRIYQRPFGGQSQEFGGAQAARTCPAADRTGHAILHTLYQQNIKARTHFFDEFFVIDLLRDAEGYVLGALVLEIETGMPLVIEAKTTLIATGGAARMYRTSTNAMINTGDGMAMALRAGIPLQDMEFMQFHPTVLYIAGSSRYLISEAVRGEGAHLLDCNGYRFMQDYNSALELASRDVVSQAITQQMAKTSHPCVYLDLSSIPAGHVRHRFPHIGQVCADFGLDLTKDKVPVRPGAHYMVGGVTTDADGRTSLPGLWAAGEVTSTGLHGANRLASNSLLEGVVFGLRCGQNASQVAMSQPDNFTAPRLESPSMAPKTRADDQLDLTDIRNSLRSLMWRNVGISRNEQDLVMARQQLDFWANYVCRRDLVDPAGWELQNMMLVARSMAAAALERRESRGVHARSDYPETLESQRSHICVRN